GIAEAAAVAAAGAAAPPTAATAQKEQSAKGDSGSAKQQSKASEKGNAKGDGRKSPHAAAAGSAHDKKLMQSLAFSELPIAASYAVVCAGFQNGAMIVWHAITGLQLHHCWAP